ANTLAFKQRGRYTTIGPAFHRTHLEAGCEFCGSCVSACPTGALSEKTRKWEGRPDSVKTTTCSLCGIGCRIDLQIKGKKVIGSLPADDSLISDKQLCVKGRFCVPEIVNSHKRLKKPYIIREGYRFNIGWNEAIDLAVEKLSSCDPDEFGMLVSANCTNEDLYIAQKFSRSAMGTHNINSDARLFYRQNFNQYIDLFGRSGLASDIQNASVILCVGLDTRYSRSVVGVELRKAIMGGAKIVTINSGEHNLATIADKCILTEPGGEGKVLETLIKLTASNRRSAPRKENTGTEKDEISQVADLLIQADRPVILIGSDLTAAAGSTSSLESLGSLADNIGASILSLPPQSNFTGTMLMGAYSELLPGGVAADDKKNLGLLRKYSGSSIPKYSRPWNIEDASAWKNLRVLYMIGEFPESQHCSADFTIIQNIFAPDPPAKADLALPAAAFTETDGTIINFEGRVQRIVKAAPPPGKALPDWKILCSIARRMGKDGFDYKNAAAIRKEIAMSLPAITGKPDISNAPAIKGRLTQSAKKPIKRKRRTDEYPLILTALTTEHTYRGISLADTVDGASVLFREDLLEINIRDARKIRVRDGDEVIVSAPGINMDLTAKITGRQPVGTLRATLSRGKSIEFNPCPVKIRKK
ncbi:MAG: molybdopterin-dependent oxidoreductase, partial [Bacteroidales bacterium]|nr:molybdopterin-dependent oxidoreductase [Candidatus Latescibacterota bacterium]